jgi:hypothetical protein
MLIEIYKHNTSWDNILDLIASVPFVIAKNIDIVHDTEVKNYPDEISLPFSIYSSPLGSNKETIINAFKINMIAKISEFARKNDLLAREILKSILLEKQNVPPDDGGKYSAFQFWLFLESNLLNMLREKHPDFIKKYLPKQGFDESLFKSFNMGSAVIFYEYYVQNKEGKFSDIGDFWHLSYLPYCHYAVLDNERLNLIYRIKNDARIKTIAHKHKFSIPLNCETFNYKGFLCELNKNYGSEV